MAGPPNLFGGAINPAANIETLAADKTLVAGTDDQLQMLATGAAANRKVILPTAAEMSGQLWIIGKTDAGGAKTLSVRDSADAADVIVMPASKQSIAYVTSDGTNYFAIGGSIN